MSFEWTPIRLQEFDELIDFMKDRNLQNLFELYGSSYLIKEQEEFYYNEENAWEDIQLLIKGEKIND